MLLRTTVMTAMTVAALAWSPAPAAAQQSGLARAAVATANADARAGWNNSKSRKERAALPRGIARVFANMPLPPGIRRLFGGAEPEPPPEPEPEPPPAEEPPDECSVDLAFVDGMLVYVDCNGNVVPGPGT